MRKAMTALPVAILIISSCSSQVVRPGTDIRGALPEKTHTLAEVWDGAEDALMEIWQPMPLDVYTEAHKVSGSGIIVIDVQSQDFDAVAAVIDGTGSLVAFNDNWGGTDNARIVLDGASEGTTLLVFSPDDSRGLYDVRVREGSTAELEEFIGSSDLQSGPVIATLEPGAWNPRIGELLSEALMTDVYNTNYSRAKLYPFTLAEGALVSLSLTSEAFDPYLVLAAVDAGALSFVAYNDDYDGTGSRIISELEAGEYVAVVMPYSEGGFGEFTLELKTLDARAMEPVSVSAEAEGVEYTGEINTDRNLAMAWWPDMESNWEAPAFLTAFTPVAAFTFTVDEPAPFTLGASSEMDVCLTLLSSYDGFVQYMGSNDDGPDMGTDPVLPVLLMPGDYVALVSTYSGTDQGGVTFIRTRESVNVSSLEFGRSIQVSAPYETENLIYRFSVTAGRTYTVSVTSADLDPVITLHLPDGALLSDDDGGEGTNSLLDFTAGQAGTCYLEIRKYSPADGSFTIELR